MRSRRSASRQSKPCPCCGTTDLYRYAEEACDDCKRDLAEFRAIKAEIEERKSTDAIVQISLPPKDSVHWWPGFYMGRDYQHDRTNERDRLRNVIAKLHYACSQPAGSEKYGASGESLTDEKFNTRVSGWQGRDQKRLMTRPQVKLFRELYTVIGECLVGTFENGKKCGQDILLNLATGEMSVQEFNKATMKAK